MGRTAAAGAPPAGTKTAPLTIASNGAGVAGSIANDKPYAPSTTKTWIAKGAGVAVGAALGSRIFGGFSQYASADPKVVLGFKIGGAIVGGVLGAFAASSAVKDSAHLNDGKRLGIGNAVKEGAIHGALVLGTTLAVVQGARTIAGTGLLGRSVGRMGLEAAKSAASWGAAGAIVGLAVGAASGLLLANPNAVWSSEADSLKGAYTNPFTLAGGVAVGGIAGVASLLSKRAGSTAAPNPVRAAIVTALAATTAFMLLNPMLTTPAHAAADVVLAEGR